MTHWFHSVQCIWGFSIRKTVKWMRKKIPCVIYTYLTAVLLPCYPFCLLACQPACLLLPSVSGATTPLRVSLMPNKFANTNRHHTLTHTYVLRNTFRTSKKLLCNPLRKPKLNSDFVCLNYSRPERELKPPTPCTFVLVYMTMVTANVKLYGEFYLVFVMEAPAESNDKGLVNVCIPICFSLSLTRTIERISITALACNKIPPAIIRNKSIERSGGGCWTCLLPKIKKLYDVSCNLTSWASTLS